MINLETIMASFHVVPIAVVVAYLVAEILKKFVLKTDNQKTILPILCGGIGAVIGIVLFKFFPEALDPDTKTWINAVADGGFSGIMATGCNQIYKQIKKFLTNSNSDVTES